MSMARASERDTPQAKNKKSLQLLESTESKRIEQAGMWKNYIQAKKTSKKITLSFQFECNFFYKIGLRSLFSKMLEKVEILIPQFECGIPPFY